MNIFEELGCEEDSEYGGIYTHELLPFELSERDGKLELRVNLEYRLDKGKIPLTKENIERLIEAFNPKK